MSNGVFLSSQINPDYTVGSKKRLFVGGSSVERRKETFIIPFDDLPKVMQAIKEYNDMPEPVPSCEGKVVEVDGKTYKLVSA